MFCVIRFLLSLLWFLKVMWKCPQILTAALTSACACLQRTLASVEDSCLFPSHLCALSSGDSDLHGAGSFPDSYKCFSLLNSAHKPSGEKDMENRMLIQLLFLRGGWSAEKGWDERLFIDKNQVYLFINNQDRKSSPIICKSEFVDITFVINEFTIK